MNMREYEVYGGVAHFGPGQVMEISEGQYGPRAHNLETISSKGSKKNTRYQVRALTSLQFKVGETVRLPELPKNLTTILAPVGKPKTPVEEIADDNKAAAANNKKWAKKAADAKAKADADGKAKADAGAEVRADANTRLGLPGSIDNPAGTRD